MAGAIGWPAAPPADADRPGRHRQDPRLALQGPPARLLSFPDGVWLVELAPLADPVRRWSRQSRACSACASSPWPLLSGG